MTKFQESGEMVAALKTLEHVSRPLPGGGEVLILNTGALIGPESDAMLQALYSRSIESVRKHLDLIAEKGSKKFMGTYYVGYGHKSIGDCGTITIFIEGVSMLAAKAIQDHPLYNGQESSTRYIDFAKQRFIDPLMSERSNLLLEDWRSFYLKGLGEMPAVIASNCPKPDGEKEDVYEKAVKARAFDIMRSFLPTGATTNVAWHVSLRHVRDRLDLLRHHPLPEVQKLAETLEDALGEAFPSSFLKDGGVIRYLETETYNRRLQGAYLYKQKTELDSPDFRVTRDTVDRMMLKEHTSLVMYRPIKTELPRWIGECGEMQFEFLLDFGSFRDIHRNRSVVQRMPLVTTKHGFGKWYLGQLTESLRTEAVELLGRQELAIDSLPLQPREAQYYVSMGYEMPNRVTGRLPGLVYTIELRTGITVHPTLRIRAQQMGQAILERLGPWFTIHMDNSPDRFNTKRGTHDIVRTA